MGTTASLVTLRSPRQRKPADVVEFAPSLGVDVGGTFTDFITHEGKSLKLLSRSAAPGVVLAAGAKQLFQHASSLSNSIQIAHGTTVATNAILTSDLARTAFLVTAGFRDVLALGRQCRPRLYDLEPKPLFLGPPSDLIIEVDERIDAGGEILAPLDCAGPLALAKSLVAQGVESFAVRLLHSYANPIHEIELTKALRGAGFAVTASSELVPEFREFERFSTAFTNAGLMPLLDAYVADLRAHAPAMRPLHSSGADPQFFLMQSDGGVIGLDLAAKEPVRLVLSGPAGGVVGAWHAASSEGRQKLITFDMGGTSTDVALLNGGEPVVGQTELAGRPLLVPVLDIHTVGAGGGSIARVDSGGALLVGPMSAGSDPGPACYGKGGPATVTDAHVLLGRIPEGHFLGGSFAVDFAAARTKIEDLARSIALSPAACALGILAVAEATMERALRRISLERGHDPRLFSLVCFGGAGALHAASLMSKLDLPEAVIPNDPGLLSAKGMLQARLKREYSTSLVGVGLGALTREPDQFFAKLTQRASQDLAATGAAFDAEKEERFCDLRYEGQSFSITIPLPPAATARACFHQAHFAQYGFDMAAEGQEVEVVALRLRIVGSEPPKLSSTMSMQVGPVAPLAHCHAVFDGSMEVPIYERPRLGVGALLSGPAIVVEYSSTTVVPPGFTLSVDERCNLIIRRSP